MPFPALDGAPADVLRLFLREAPYLFFGSAFAAIGLVAGSFVAIRQRRDTLLTFFALFAILCGLRLWIQSDIVVLALGKSFLLEQLRTDIEFLIPVPMFLFFVAAGYDRRTTAIQRELEVATKMQLSFAGIRAVSALPGSCALHTNDLRGR